MNLLSLFGLALSLLQVSSGNVIPSEASDNSNMDEAEALAEKVDNESRDANYSANVLEQSFEERWKDPRKCTNTCRCGPSNEKVSRIVGGVEPGPYVYNWIVPIFIKGETRPTGSGALITDRHILTSYAVAKASRNLVARLGDGNIGPNANAQTAIDIDILSVSTHENYTDLDIDIGILILAQPINISATSGVDTICLPEFGRNYYNQPAIFLGHGNVKPEGQKWSRNVVKADLKTRSNGYCTKNYPNYPPENVYKICADGKGSPCTGDRGGPLALKDESTDTYKLIGYSSQDYMCGNKFAVGIFGRVAELVPWIHRATKLGVYCGPCTSDNLIDKPVQPVQPVQTDKPVLPVIPKPIPIIPIQPNPIIPIQPNPIIPIPILPKPIIPIPIISLGRDNPEGDNSDKSPSE
ncbi:clotting factor G beta subunit-like [Oratosquilla oratoria]|uniref:clotting factor G beta subunit-like n=1 Tax=Oratosquilla oratoria TaxID=337810 RepID=UPI003F765E9A